MSAEEERLSQLLKRIVPEPPFQLSADQITTHPARRPARSWLLPAMAAAAVLVIGATAGAIAAHHSRAGVPAGTPKVPGQLTSSASPHPTPTCRKEVAAAKPGSTTRTADPGYRITTWPSATAPCRAASGTPPARNATEVVPNVTGMASSQAVRVGEAAGFNVEVKAARPSSAGSAPPGTVSRQAPAPGSTAPRGTDIVIYVAPAS